MSKITLNETGIQAPAMLTRDYRTTYRWIKDGCTYRQEDSPNGKNWVKIENAPPVEGPIPAVSRRYVTKWTQSGIDQPPQIPGVGTFYECNGPMINTLGANITFGYTAAGTYEILSDTPIFDNCTTHIDYQNNVINSLLGGNIVGYAEILFVILSPTRIAVTVFDGLVGGLPLNNFIDGTLSIEIFD